MCGIIGFNWEDKGSLMAGLKEIKHRGPDDSGVYFDKGISLGHRRLSIIDLSRSGKQPLTNEEGDVIIVFNGEIYNFMDLKNSLKGKHNFKSNTDTEVLVHLYEEEGIKMLDKIQGMFAFCIYDVKKKTLFLARDRVGIKPLYYYKDESKGKFSFCSEIKGILKSSKIKAELNPKALVPYFVFRANIFEETYFKGIRKLMPGHYLAYNLKNNDSRVEKYWDVSFKQKDFSEPYLLKKLRSLLEDSVHCRLMSDVPYGAYLSGGVDSGVVVSLMKRTSKSPDKIKTFSVGFEDGEHTETEEARFLSEEIGTDHHELLIKENSVKRLPEIVYQSDEPLADPTSVPIYLLSEYTKKFCTVVLTGEGADEIFAGYPQYKFINMHDKVLSKVPHYFRGLIPKLVRLTPDYLLDKAFRFSSSLGDKGLERFSEFIKSKKTLTQYLSQVSIFNEREQGELLNKKISFDGTFKHLMISNLNPVSNCQRLEFKGPMVDDLLMKIDKNTMAFAVEGRVPFLDHRVVELGSSVPESMKLKGLTGDKLILRKAVKGLIPEQTRMRKKRHFFVPINSWFSEELNQLREDLLSKKEIEKQGIFDYHYIRKINDGFNKSKLYYSRQLWSLITFQLWYKQFIVKEKIII